MGTPGWDSEERAPIATAASAAATHPFPIFFFSGR
jgi:hypothetical protein